MGYFNGLAIYFTLGPVTGFAVFFFLLYSVFLSTWLRSSYSQKQHVALQSESIA